MKKTVLLLLISMLCIYIASAKPIQDMPDVVELTPASSAEQEAVKHRDPTREYEVYHVFDFEGEDYLDDEWDTGDYYWDVTIIPPAPVEYWKLINHSDFDFAHEGANYSWWPGTVSIGGYRNARLLWLQSPEVNLTGVTNPKLTFDFNMYYEELGGAAPYNGWDGWNIRISNDNGATWTVLNPTSPDYNSSSMYCFGFNGEGPNIPGWGGLSEDLDGEVNGWVSAEFDLSAYANDTVLIRFYHSADPAYDTEGDPHATPNPLGDPDMFGVAVCNIVIGDNAYNFTSADDTQGFTTGHIHNSGVDIWQVRSPYDDASSPVSVITPAIETAPGVWNYVDMMYNYIVTPWVTLPVGGDIYMDFNFVGYFNYFSSTNADGIAVEVYHDLETANDYKWYNIRDPYNYTGRPTYTINNYYNTHQDNGEMVSWANFWMDYETDITQLQGKDVRFRIIVFAKNPGQGRSMKIDDWAVHFEQKINPPSNFTAEVTPENTVEMSWTLPIEEPGTVLTGIQVQRKAANATSFNTIATLGSTATTHTDTDPIRGNFSTYRVAAVYDVGTIPGTEERKVLALHEDQHLMTAGITGLSDTLTQPTATGRFVNKFDITDTPLDDFYIRFIKVYFTRPGATASYIDFYPVDANGEPGDRIITVEIPDGTALQGWNIIELSSTNSPHLTDSFFAGFRLVDSEGPNIGVSAVLVSDTASWTAANAGGSSPNWQPYTDGNFMFQVITQPIYGLADKEVTILPVGSKLSARNYPNPFNPNTTIAFNLPSAGRTRVQVYNIKGQLVNTLLNEEMTAGNHTVHWNGKDVAGHGVTSGIYFYRVECGMDSVVNKMILLK